LLSLEPPAEHREKLKKDEVIQEQYQLLLKRHQFNYYSSTFRALSVQYFPVDSDYPRFTITFRIKQERTSDEWNTVFNRSKYSAHQSSYLSVLSA
jgi:hypothetical protein